MPMKTTEEVSSINGLIGILVDYPEMSVDNFLARMDADQDTQ